MKPSKHQRNKQRCLNYTRRSTTLHNVLFCAHTLCMSYVTNTFLLVSSSVRSKQLLCFVHGQGRKNKNVFFYYFFFVCILKNLILTPKNDVRPYPTIHREQKDGRCTFTTTPCEPNYTGLLMSSLNGLQFFLVSLLAFSCAKHYR